LGAFYRFAKIMDFYFGLAGAADDDLGSLKEPFRL
jgi:hypothetical protein